MFLRPYFLLLALSIACFCQAQKGFSLATDLSLLQNVQPKQRFFTIGQTLKVNLHLGQKDAVYVWLSYYGKGNFRFRESALANSPFASPQRIDFSVRSTLRYNQFSVGWKRYFKGDFEEEKGLNIYGYAGFGLLRGRVENRYSQPIDSSRYSTGAPLEGRGRFARLTVDGGLGAERSVAPYIFVYSELRTWLPASDYPSKYLRRNDNMPSVIALNIGARLLF